MVDYYISKGFFILENNSSDLRDFPICVKIIIDAEHLHPHDFAMACYREIPSADNTLKELPFLLVCKDSLHQSTTMINEIIVGTFLGHV